MAAAVAVVGTDHTPLFLKNFTSEDNLKFHSLVHVALDAFDEKASRAERATAPKGASDAFYLGLLYPTEDYNVYGYVSSTRVKFMLVLGAPLRDAARDDVLRAALRQLHVAYVYCVMNPFFQPDAPISSPAFDAAVDEIAAKITPSPAPAVP